MKRTFSSSPRNANGFTLIEVMIAVLILGFGLLGFALLQTMSVRFVNSANQRTQATNLAYDMLDQMRVNRIAAINYAGNYTATEAGCAPNAAVTAATYKAIWQCRLNYALGGGSTAIVTYAAGVATVSITWGDERWREAANERNRTFSVRTLFGDTVIDWQRAKQCQEYQNESGNGGKSLRGEECDAGLVSESREIVDSCQTHHLPPGMLPMGSSVSDLFLSGIFE